MEQNQIFNELIELGICDESSISLFHTGVRDRKDINVMHCKKSDVLFLDQTNHMNLDYYQDKDGRGFYEVNNNRTFIGKNYLDINRRADLLRDLIFNKDYLDVGTGAGHLLTELGVQSDRISAVEPQLDMRLQLTNAGFKVWETIASLPDNSFDIISLFHVYEHFTSPLNELKLLYNKVRENGRIIIEVPHARDFLLCQAECAAFRDFTFWSEHLLLHTRESLTAFLKCAQFRNVTIEGVQRYPLANHLYWLTIGKPSGQNHWNFMKSGALDSAYSERLAAIDATDTLLAIAFK